MLLSIKIVHTLQYVYDKEKYKNLVFDFDWLNDIIQ